MNRSPQEVFDAVVDLPASERDAELDRLCGDNATLRKNVESLLDAHDSAGEFLADPTIHPESFPLEETTSSECRSVRSGYAGVTEGPGHSVDRYKLLEKIGEGGFGVVYMAQQDEPVRRRVALKIIKLGMDTRQVIARFEAERQALAMMDHPNIARVIDGGSTAAGRPFFVMELVRGETITEYCDQNKLPLRERLKLFQQVCRAITHAHQKGIIHRDIKPSNVLVTITDDKPMAKVIDFGIAKATTAELTDKTLFTEFRQLIGTPLYMSPEQAQRSGVDVDTRTDIYSLGVLLYEMLTGRTPLDPKKLSSTAWAEWQRMIVEDEPTRPSLMVSSSQDEELAELARRRGIPPSRFGAFLRGDLDWIVLKSIDKARSRRYATAAALSDDVERFLDGDAVLATPPSRLYRLQKFVTRNRRWLTSAAALLVMLLAGLVATSVTATWAIRSERATRQALDRAKANERSARRAATLASSSQTLPETEARSLAKSWQEEIASLQADPSDSEDEVNRQQVQFAAWFSGWLIRNGHVAEAHDLVERHFAQAREFVGIADPTFLELCNTKLIVMEQTESDAAEYAATYSDLIDSVREVRGQSDAVPLLPQYATALVRAGRAVEARSVVAQYGMRLSEAGRPLSPAENARLDSAIDRLMNWQGLASSEDAMNVLKALQELRATGRLIERGDSDEELVDDLAKMQGRWRYRGWERGKLVEHMIVEIDGDQSETRFLDESARTIRGRSTRIELSRSGGVKVFRSFHGDEADVGGAFVYEIWPHRLTLVSGLLQNDVSLPEVKLRNFFRMKPGETDSGTIEETDEQSANVSNSSPSRL